MLIFYRRSFEMSGLIRQLLTRNPSKLLLSRAASLSNFTVNNRKERKRFYKEVTVAQSTEVPQSYEINLDKRKLRTPGGQAFAVNNELLANMIAIEWQSQKSLIKQYTMHLTSLTNTCIDNPGKVTKETLISNLNEYLQTDTLLFFDSDSIAQLDQLQETKWRPVVEWFNQKFPDINLKISYEINEDASTKIPQGNNSLNRFLERSFDLNTLIAFNYIVECLKSVILAVALLERRIQTVDEACRLAFLEQSHQYDKWGKVEWYHDINENESVARVSAALCLIYLSNGSKYLVTKTKE